MSLFILVWEYNTLYCSFSIYIISYKISSEGPREKGGYFMNLIASHIGLPNMCNVLILGCWVFYIIACSLWLVFYSKQYKYSQVKTTFK